MKYMIMLYASQRDYDQMSGQPTDAPAWKPEVLAAMHEFMGAWNQELVEWGLARAVFQNPQHPYTRMLLDAIPDLEMSGRGRVPVAGEVPSPINPPSGCTFHPRCPFANERCRTETPRPIRSGPSQVRCHAVEEGRLDKKTVRRTLVQQSYPAPGD